MSDAKKRLKGGFYPNRSATSLNKTHLSGGFYPNRSATLLNKTHLSGGFYPSAMGSILTTGPFFMTAAFYQGRRLLTNNTKRMATRRGFQKTRKRSKFRAA